MGFPLYGSTAFLFEPLHNRLRRSPRPVRGAAYALGFLAVELLAGYSIERMVGQVPWDYRGRTRFAIGGYTRLDYAPLWFLVGLGLEPVHDALAAKTPSLLAALHHVAPEE